MNKTVCISLGKGVVRAATMILALALAAGYGAAAEKVETQDQVSLVKAIPLRETTFLSYSDAREGGSSAYGAAAQSLVPVIAVDSSATLIRLKPDSDEARSAYGFVVPAGQTLRVELDNPRASWFQVAMVNRYGLAQGGTYANKREIGRPVAIFTNTSKEAQAIYLLVRYPEFIYYEGYENGGDIALKIERAS